MSQRRRTGHLLVTLAAGERAPHVPAHVDVLAGAARPVATLAGGAVDRVIDDCCGAFRATAVFQARRSMGRAGSRATGYDDVEEHFGLSRTYRVHVAAPDGADRALDRLRALDGVESAGHEVMATTSTVVEHPRQVTSEDALAPYAQVRSPEALALEAGDERVTVAVVDTGVSLGHPEFQRRLLSGYDVVELGMGPVSPDIELIGDSRGRDFAAGDEAGHGSHVGGIISAQGWRIPPGVAGRSLLLPIRVLAAGRIQGSEPTGVGALGDIDCGIKVCCDLGAEVINLSFGTPERVLDPAAPKPHAAVVAYALARGCVVVAASGNSGQEEAFYPAALPGVIAVGSVDPAGTRSVFSTYGPHIALSAPGERIFGVDRTGYSTSTGTSHAAPFVTGAAALMLARARRTGRVLAAAEVRTLLTGTAGPARSPGSESGAGVVDVHAALQALDRGLDPRLAHQGNHTFEGANDG